MKYMRMMPQGLQVPEITYVKDNKNIVIQGAIHIGSRKFYEKVVDRIKGFNGETHLEGIISTDEKYSSNKELLNNVYDTMAAFSNLSYQKEFINKNLADDKKVFNYDLEDNGLSDSIFNEKVMQSLKEMDSEKIASITNSSMLNIGSSPLFNFLMGAAGNGSLPAEVEEIVLHKRNDYAISKAFETDKNVFMFWGAKHIEGMSEILLNNGYETIRTKWLTAIPTLRLKKNHEHRKSTILANLTKIQEIVASVE